jgi:import inner membrane translocase subunit TIM22
MQNAMESCPLKTVISGTMGFGLGGVFGLFMASVWTIPQYLSSV